MLIFLPITHVQARTVSSFEIDNEQTIIRAEKIIRQSYFTFWAEEEWWSDLEQIEQDKYETSITELIDGFREHHQENIKSLTTISHSVGRTKSIHVIVMPLEKNIYSYARDKIIYVNAEHLDHEDIALFLSVSFVDIKIEEVRGRDPLNPEETIVQQIIRNALPAYKATPSFAAQHYRAFEKNAFSSDDWIALFTYFIAENTSKDFFTDLSKSKLQGVEAINESLKRAESQETYGSLFRDWSVAIISNKSSLQDENVTLYENDFIDAVVFSGFKNKKITGKQETITLAPHSTQWIRYTPNTLGIDRQSQNILKIAIQPPLYPFQVTYIATDINGQKQLHHHTINENDAAGEIEIGLFGTYILSVTVVMPNPTNTTQNVTIKAYQDLSLQDGDIIQYRDDIFVIKGRFIRKILSPEIFNSYGHLSWNNVKEVDASTITQYQGSQLIKTVRSDKVFEIDSNGTAHWLDITPQQFEASGRRWDEIFIVNEYEMAWYTVGEKYTE